MLRKQSQTALIIAIHVTPRVIETTASQTISLRPKYSGFANSEFVPVWCMVTWIFYFDVFSLLDQHFFSANSLFFRALSKMSGLNCCQHLIMTNWSPTKVKQSDSQYPARNHTLCVYIHRHSCFPTSFNDSLNLKVILVHVCILSIPSIRLILAIIGIVCSYFRFYVKVSINNSVDWTI